VDKLNNQQLEGLWITPEQFDLMHADVNSRAPEEACGILAGQGGHVLEVFPATNTLHSHVRYRIEPKEQLDIFNQIDERGWNLLAIYHSHPNGPAHPSATDIQEAYYPEAIYLIWAQTDGIWSYKGFLIQGGKYAEVPIYLSPSD
jgi:proteasome lid subunit RPN8/RPN11